MSLAEKYGFVLFQAEADSPAVRYFIEDHLSFYGYPADVQPSSTTWYGVCREGNVYGVVGVRPLSEKTVEVPDFFFQRSRWGILAGYAALELIKELAIALKIEVITATPVWNKRMMKAIGA